MIEGKAICNIIHITPKVEEITSIKKLTCPENDCQKTFSNAGNYRMHLERHHRKESQFPTVDTNEFIYFCPEKECIYHESSINGKHFTRFKYLRQHYQKVHITKTFQCDKCKKLFPTDSVKVSHETNCGRSYKCDECGWSYKTREALLTHAKRKSHKIDVCKTRNIQIKRATDEKSINTTVTTLSSPVQILFKLSTSTQNQSVQTDPVEVKGVTKKRSNYVRQPRSKKNKNEKNKSEKSKNVSIKPKVDYSCINNNVTSTNLKDNLNQLNCTDTNRYEQFISSSSLCDIETQTEFSTEILDQMLYSNMHTQTCDEFLSELGLSDIQTQTNWSPIDEPENVAEYVSGLHDEMLVSTETQTSFTQCLLEYNNSTGNNCNGITQHTQTCCSLLEGLFGGQESDLIGNFQSTHTQT